MIESSLIHRKNYFIFFVVGDLMVELRNIQYI